MKKLLSAIFGLLIFGWTHAQIILPIEVVGEEGKIVSRSFNIVNRNGAASLWIQANNLSYDNKGFVKLNDGAWVNLTNTNVICNSHDEKYGCIGNGYSTIRFRIPISENSLRNGNNTIQFRFNTTDGTSIGFRIIQFNIWDESGNPMIPASAFEEDNPANWNPINGNIAAINAGKQAWYSADLISDYTSTATPIKAKCSSCHAQDGRDLKYFNYSNHSIIERSKFHGLSQQEAENIASYIRSLNQPAHGRPWNPPYQPGPGMDSKPVEQWAAGAGLDAVLESDADMKSYLDSDPSITGDAINIDGSLNSREIPLSIQFPDWKSWLPKVHPLDLWGEGFVNEPAFKAYQDLVDELNTPGKVNELITNQTIDDKISAFITKADNLRRDFDTGVITDIDPDLGRSNIMHWNSIKQWEIMQEFGLEDDAKQVYGNQAEMRSWMSSRRNVFELAPHRTASNKINFADQSALEGKYFSTAWYQLQVVLNNGNKEGIRLWPVDWNYQPNHISDLYKYDGPKHPYRLLHTFLVMLQQYNQDDFGKEDFGYKQIHPIRIAPGGPLGNTFSDLPDADKKEIYEIFLNGLMEKLSRHEISEVLRRGGPGSDNQSPEPADYQPVLITNQSYAAAHHSNRFADGWITAIYEFNKLGVNKETICAMQDWGMAMWPNGDWSQTELDCTADPFAQPIAWYDFEGNANDIIGNHNGTLKGGASTNNDGQLTTDGDNDWVDIAHNDFTLAFTERSFSAWVKVNDTNVNQVIFEEGGAWKGIGLRIRNGNIEARARQDNAHNVELSTPITASVWQHIAMVFDEGNLLLYVNGELKGSDYNGLAKTIGIHNNPAGLACKNGDDVWESGTGQSYFLKGYMDDVKIFDKAISTDQINAEMGETPMDAIEGFQQDNGADGLVIMEAEDFHHTISQGGKAFIASNLGDFSGSGAMVSSPNTQTNNNTGYVTNSPRLDYNINFTKTGIHYVWLLMQSQGSGSDDSFHAGLNNTAISSADRISGNSSEWIWTNNTMDGAPATIDVANAGMHTFNIWMREDGAHIDKIILTKNPNYDPSASTNNRIESLSQTTGSYDIKAYPNPVQNRLSIALGEPISANIQIIDMMGKVIFQHDYADTDSIRLDARLWLSGAYFIRLKTTKGIEIIRFLKK